MLELLALLVTYVQVAAVVCGHREPRSDSILKVKLNHVAAAAGDQLCQSLRLCSMWHV